MSLAPSKELEEVNELINKRLKQLTDTKKILTLGKSQAELVLSTFAKELSNFINIAFSSDAEYFTNEIEKINSRMLQDVPLEALNATTINGVMHERFKNLAAAVLNSDYVADFMMAATKHGCELLKTDAEEATGSINTLSAFMSKHCLELADYLDNIAENPESDLFTKISQNSELIQSSGSDILNKLMRGVNDIISTNYVSQNNASNISDACQNFISLLGTLEGKNPALSWLNIAENIQSSLAIAEAGINNLNDSCENIPNIAETLPDINMSELLQESFDKLLNAGISVSNLAKQIITHARSGNADSLIMGINNSITQAHFIKGYTEAMAKESLKASKALPIEHDNALQALKSGFDSFLSTFPNDSFRILKNDVNTIADITKNLMTDVKQTNRKQRPTASEILDIGSRIATKSSEIVNHVADLITSASAFQPIISEIATQALNALRSIGEAPLDALSRGKVLTFTKTLTNPAMLTKIGQCQEAIATAMKEPDISSAERGMLITLLDYVSGEAERELLDQFVNDITMQKSMAVQGIDKYIKEILEPRQRLLEKYRQAKNQRSGGNN